MAPSGWRVREASASRGLQPRRCIIATGSDPFVPPGINTDGRTVFTSDDAINLEFGYRAGIAIIGSGYIGLRINRRPSNNRPGR